jgi:hypothetical protein
MLQYIILTSLFTICVGTNITTYYKTINTYDKWLKVSIKTIPDQSYLIENYISIKDDNMTNININITNLVIDLINIVTPNIVSYKIKSIFMNSQKKFNGPIITSGFNMDDNGIYYCFDFNTSIIINTIDVTFYNKTFVNITTYTEPINNNNIYCEYIITIFNNNNNNNNKIIIMATTIPTAVVVVVIICCIAIACSPNLKMKSQVYISPQPNRHV